MTYMMNSKICQKKDFANFGFNMRYDILMEGEDRPADRDDIGLELEDYG